ncbi:MAG: hypothetical protein WC394_01010 [Candidatus Omnitrophota bacterium]|jgi:hypothetical protein
MSIGLINKKGQAAAELAILGVLALLAFSFVMNFGQSLGRAQQVRMESFRKALRKAYDKNGSVSYTLRKNVNMASVNSGFFQGQDSAAENTGSVTWSKGLSGPSGTTDEGSYAYWQINRNLPIEPGYYKEYQYGPTGSRSDEKIKIPVSVYKVDEIRRVDYTYNLEKRESSGNDSAIDYSKRATLVDTSTGLLYTRIDKNIDKNPGDDNVPTPHYQVRGVRPFGDQQIYTYSEDWKVPHDLQE